MGSSNDYQYRIKNLNMVRSYIREIYVNGFKSRTELGGKSARSHDNELRRIRECLRSWVRSNGEDNKKAAYISIDSRTTPHNPVYAAFRMKSCTDKDMMLHFYLLDILADGKSYTSKEILERMNTDYWDRYAVPVTSDESTVRTKLKEYTAIGILTSTKQGNRRLYTLAQHALPVESLVDLVDFYEEESPIGVVGSYVQDHIGEHEDILRCRNHYYMNACDSEVLEILLQAIHEHRKAAVTSFARKRREQGGQKGTGSKRLSEAQVVVPLKIYVSTANGRNYLLCRTEEGDFQCRRIDNIESVDLGDIEESYAEILEEGQRYARYLWGISAQSDSRSRNAGPDTSQNIRRNSDPGSSRESLLQERPWQRQRPEPSRVEMEIRVGEREGFIRDRFYREKRQGTVTELDNGNLLLSIEVYDPAEMTPWIRTYIGRIVRITSRENALEQRIREDLQDIIAMYDGGRDAVS